jgi:hypothetical protein
MRTNARLKKIEKELQSQPRIPNSEGYIVFRPGDTEEEKELKVGERLEELRRKYGEGVSRQDVVVIQTIYDKAAEAVI